jgi:hypothetical protein
MKLVLVLIFLFNIANAKISENTRVSLHICISGMSSLSISLLSNSKTNLSQEKIFLVSTSIGLIPGIGKEIYDYSKGFDFSLKDIGCDLTGTVLFSGSYYLFKKLNS